MRATLAAILLLSASAIPLAARADTVDVMTVTGNGHTWTFDFPLIQNFTYPITATLFVPGITPLSETIDGTSVTPTEIFIHPFSPTNINGPFGQIIPNNDYNPLDILSTSGPFTNPVTMQNYFAYTSTLNTGPFSGTEVISNTIVPFTVDIEQQSTAATPEPPALLFLATAAGALAIFRRRTTHA